MLFFGKTKKKRLPYYQMMLIVTLRNSLVSLVSSYNITSPRVVLLASGGYGMHGHTHGLGPTAHTGLITWGQVNGSLRYHRFQCTVLSLSVASNITPKLIPLTQHGSWSSLLSSLFKKCII